MTELLEQLIKLRHNLHRDAELSNREEKTAGIIREFLQKFPPDSLIPDLGGPGLAAIYRGPKPGPVLLLRAEMDALPIPETIALDYSSQTDGVSHKCGHDGHMAILSGVAARLHENRPAVGQVVLLYQPAEETGQGARRVLDDPGFESIQPDLAIALHNLPGFPPGQIILRDGVFAAASKGLVARFQGRTAHAAEPEKGHSPALAVAQLIQSLSAVPQFYTRLPDAAKVTVIHAQVGNVAFGTSPGEGVVMATLRAYSAEVMDTIANVCTKLIRATADTYQLDTTSEWVEEFPATRNHSQATKVIRQAATALDMAVNRPGHPFPWSEDFGHFTQSGKGALFGLGAGVHHPNLHNSDYDFPDKLIEPGLRVFWEIIQQYLGNRD